MRTERENRRESLSEKKSPMRVPDRQLKALIAFLDTCTSTAAHMTISHDRKKRINSAPTHGT